MKLRLTLIAFAGIVLSTAAFAQSAAPAGSTGLCKDGTYSTNATKKGACAGHKGVKDWYATNEAAPAAAPAQSKTEEVKKAPAAGGGAGQVWVNTNSKVYHCPGTKYYGTTKQGEYMSEAAAKSSGAKADHGKACS